MVVWLSWRSACCGVTGAPGCAMPACGGAAGARSAAIAVEGLLPGPTASCGWAGRGAGARRAGGAGASAGTAAVEGLSAMASGLFVRICGVAQAVAQEVEGEHHDDHGRYRQHQPGIEGHHIDVLG